MTETPLPGTSASDSLRTLPREACRCLRQNIIPGILLVIVIAILYALSKYNFALFHTAIEFSTIAVAVAIFLLAWKSRGIVHNNYLLFIGVTFVFIAVLDFLHTTVYQGVGIFPDGGGSLSTRLWIGARYMEAVTLLAAPLVIRRKPRMDLVAIAYLAADIIIVGSIFVFQVFPATYIPGVGLTPFKIISEYIICILLAGSVVLLYRYKDSFDRQVLDNLVIAIILTIISEISFTEYASFIDIFSVIGHVVRLLAYYFFFRAIIEVGQEKPYNLLYRSINESEKKYRALSDLSPDAILVHRHGIILYVNQAAIRFFGTENAQEIIGKSSFEYLHPDDLAAGEARTAAVEEKEATIPLTEVRYVLNGKVIPAEVTAGPILWEGTAAVQLVIRDISSRKAAEEELVRKNAELNSANQELNATNEELNRIRDKLGRANEELVENETELRQKNADLITLNNELTHAEEQIRSSFTELSLREKKLQENEIQLKEALREKEVLLSEIHHRVKNNLTAFISLLSLEGSYEESEAGRALKKDLQNRARSMALIHETLYRTHMFSRVNMQVYLASLIEQIAMSYNPRVPVRTVVDADISLDLARATPCGLIVNELITNSFKYAFPESFDCSAERGEPCTIRVAIRIVEGNYQMEVADNGKGLPMDLDIKTAKSLGLKLVNFLARHQLRAKIEVRTERGTEFIIRFHNTLPQLPKAPRDDSGITG